jgi:hypothetical protein
MRDRWDNNDWPVTCPVRLSSSFREEKWKGLCVILIHSRQMYYVENPFNNRDESSQVTPFSPMPTLSREPGPTIVQVFKGGFSLQNR